MQRIFLMVLLSFSFSTTSFDKSESNSYRQESPIAINVLIDDFCLSIINKKSFNKLFYAEDTPWLGVFSNPNFKMIQNRNSETH